MTAPTVSPSVDSSTLPAQSGASIRGRRRNWSDSDVDLLRSLYATTPTVLIAENLGRSLKTTYAKAADLGLKKSPEYFAAHHAGRTDGQRGAGTRFKPGQAPWNKGKAYKAGGRSDQTQFRKGNRPHTWMPVGTYRVNADGYLDRKVTDEGRGPRDWVSVHRLVWTEHNGPIPEGHIVVFKPGRRTTELDAITIDALECITRRELAARNTIHRYPPELKAVIRMAAKLRRRIDEHPDH